ncbi:MAG: lysophospholipase [Betaproteobacteria bacterium]|nr:lysophospholipase [Betaproteobacteria bacterium]
MGAGNAAAQTSHISAPYWVTSWAASVQGPYPAGNPSAQPDLRLAFPEPGVGARNQSFRLMVAPTLWGRQARLRFSNALGTRPLELDGVYVGLQANAATLVPGSNRQVTFAGQTRVRVPIGSWVWSDPVVLPFAAEPREPLLAGRRLAISFHVPGESGPMTWHAKALQTSYLSYPDADAHGADEGETQFPITTTSWYFLDAIDMEAAEDAFAVVCFGDSITDGTLSTLNGDDRWPDVLARRLRAHHGNRIAVLNAGIGGNQVAGPAEYDASKPFPGGPSAAQRLERDVLSLSGVGAVIWLEGINDFSRNGSAGADRVRSVMIDSIRRMRTKLPAARLLGATLPPALGATLPAHGSAEQDDQRRQLNDFIRSSDLFDAVIDFDHAIGDAETGALRTPFVHNTTTGGEGDKLHPNRLGYLQMGMAIDLGALLPLAKSRQR